MAEGEHPRGGCWQMSHFNFGVVQIAVKLKRQMKCVEVAHPIWVMTRSW